jgi:hypothetical protein
MLSKDQFKISPVFACLVILFLLTLSFIGGKCCVQAYLMISQGITVNGTAVSTSPVLGMHHPSGYNYNLYYNFDYNGVTYHGETVPPDDWIHKTSLPCSIRVRFLPSNPNMHQPLDFAGNPLWSNITLTLIFLSLAILLGIKAVLDSRGCSKHNTNS